MMKWYLASFSLIEVDNLLVCSRTVFEKYCLVSLFILSFYLLLQADRKSVV